MKKTIGKILTIVVCVPILVGAVFGIGWGIWLLGKLLLPYGQYIGIVLLGILAIFVGIGIVGGIVAGLIRLLDTTENSE